MVGMKKEEYEDYIKENPIQNYSSYEEKTVKLLSIKNFPYVTGDYCAHVLIYIASPNVSGYKLTYILISHNSVIF